MEPKNEMDELMKRSLQFDENELPEPDAQIQKKLRKHVERRKRFSENRFINNLLTYLNMDIKLYHAGIAVTAVILIFILFRPPVEHTPHDRNNLIIADTNIGSSLRQDTFLVRCFSTGIN